MHLVATHEYLRFYEVAQLAAPWLRSYGTWWMTPYQVSDSLRPIAPLDVRRVEVRALAEVPSQSRCFPKRPRRHQHVRNDDPMRAWHLAVDALSSGDDQELDRDSVSRHSSHSEVESAEGSADVGSDGEVVGDGDVDALLGAPSSCESGEVAALSDSCSASSGSVCSDDYVSVATSDLEVSSASECDDHSLAGADVEEAPVGDSEVAPSLVVRAPPAAPIGPRMPADCTVAIPDVGVIRFYASRREFVAHCSFPGHVRCRLTRSSQGHASSARCAQGRPLGLLAAWLQARGSCADKDSHVRMPLPDLASRIFGRELLKGVAEAADLFLAERPLRDGESEEPTMAL